MKEVIKQQNISNEFYTPEKCYINELSNTPEDPDASISRARVEPGVTTRWHCLRGTVERYYIVNGRGRVEVGELPPHEVNAGDIVLIPPMCPQRIAYKFLSCHSRKWSASGIPLKIKKDSRPGESQRRPDKPE